MWIDFIIKYIMKSSIYCINLDRRTDKWDGAKKEFQRVGIYDNMIRFPAYEGRWRGCRDSHIAVMRLAQYDDMVIIFEDDPRFLVDDIDPLCIYKPSFRELPDDWDVLYFGGSPQDPQAKYSEHLYHAHNVICMHAYAINNKNHCIDFVLEHKKDIAKIDLFFAQVVQEYFKCFLTKPMVCTQRQYQSDTCGKSDVSTIVRNYDKYCK